MKTLTLIAIALAGALSAFADQPVVRLSEPVTVSEEHETFGRPLVVDTDVHSLAEVMSRAEQLLDRRVLVEARVSRVCQKKGCFFIATDGDNVVRVSFRDYGFFVPTDIGSKSVLLDGSLVKVERSPAQATHLKEDAGDNDASLDAGVVYEIVADAVRVPRA
ncbi:MAG: DUF4920 domain-containing protein [Pseudomonadota bacterium]